MSDPLVCSRCDVSYQRPISLKHSAFQQCAFVCENCRCKDCGIVLDWECECGKLHAERSLEDNQVCVECQVIRQRVSNLEPELLKLRKNQIRHQEPVYGFRVDVKTKEHLTV